jgi:hypothetical protein
MFLEVFLGISKNKLQEQNHHTPNSRILDPQVPQNSRWTETPDPLSAIWMVGWPEMILKAFRGILTVMPKGVPNNF